MKNTWKNSKSILLLTWNVCYSVCVKNRNCVDWRIEKYLLFNFCRNIASGSPDRHWLAKNIVCVANDHISIISFCRWKTLNISTKLVTFTKFLSFSCDQNRFIIGWHFFTWVFNFIQSDHIIIIICIIIVDDVSRLWFSDYIWKNKIFPQVSSRFRWTSFVLNILVSNESKKVEFLFGANEMLSHSQVCKP